MRALLILIGAIIALASRPAEAQMLTLGVGPGGFSSGGAAYVGPGDIRPTAAGWWGVRAYSAAWADGTHVAANVLRASDSQTCDVFLDTTGGLGSTTACSGAANGTPIATFCNATTCTVPTFYDQSGNSRPWGGGVAPTLVFNCVTTKQCLRFNGSTNYFQATGTALSQPITIVMVLSGNSAANTVYFGESGGSGMNIQHTASANTVGSFFGNTVTATASDNAFHVLQFDNNTSSSAIQVDATLTGSLNVGTNTMGATWSLAAIPGGGFVSTIDILEVGVWNSAFTDSTLNTNAHTYYGF